MQREKILIVEDDTNILRGLVHNIGYEGYEVRTVTHGAAALSIIAEFEPDLIVLDLMLPGRNGLDILTDLRAGGNEVYVIILSARSSESEKVQGLELGADDYIGKPFGLDEFLARVNAAMRRIRKRKVEKKALIEHGGLCIDPDAKSVSLDGQMLKFTPKALELLIFFAQHPHRVYSREALLDHVWSGEYEGTARTIDNFVLQIRSQIEANPNKPERLETVHGLGYRFDPKVAPQKGES